MGATDVIHAYLRASTLVDHLTYPQTGPHVEPVNDRDRQDSARALPVNFG